MRTPIVLAALLALAVPAASAEPCIHFERDIPLPRVATPDLNTPTIHQADKHVGVDPQPVGPVDVGPVGADVPGFTIEGLHVDGIVIYDGDDTDVEFDHCF